MRSHGKPVTPENSQILIISHPRSQFQRRLYYLDSQISAERSSDFRFLTYFAVRLKERGLWKRGSKFIATARRGSQRRTCFLKRILLCGRSPSWRHPGTDALILRGLRQQNCHRHDDADAYVISTSNHSIQQFVGNVRIDPGVDDCRCKETESNEEPQFNSLTHAVHI